MVENTKRKSYFFGNLVFKGALKSCTIGIAATSQSFASSVLDPVVTKTMFLKKIQNLIFEESSSANLRRPLRRMICDMKGERGRSFRSKRKREGYLVGQQKEENRRPLQKLKRMNCQI